MACFYTITRRFVSSEGTNWGWVPQAKKLAITNPVGFGLFIVCLEKNKPLALRIVLKIIYLKIYGIKTMCFKHPAMPKGSICRAVTLHNCMMLTELNPVDKLLLLCQGHTQTHTLATTSSVLNSLFSRESSLTSEKISQKVDVTQPPPVIKTITPFLSLQPNDSTTLCTLVFRTHVS